jgi:hypothetical protein
MKEGLICSARCETDADPLCGRQKAGHHNFSPLRSISYNPGTASPSMDLQAYHIQAAEAAAAAVHAEDDDDVVELGPKKAVLLKLEVEAGMADVGASSNRTGLSPFLGGGNAEAGSRARDLTCPECGKTFLSDKAMYGHLRSHPERGYKGAIRPATASLAAAAGEKKPTRKVPRKKAGESPATDLSATPVAVGEKRQREEGQHRTRWPVTAKRGRATSTPISAGSAPAAAVQSSSCCSGDEEIAMILLKMASGSGTASEAQQSRQPVRTRDAKHQIPEVDNEQLMVLDHVAQNQMVPELPQLMTLDHVASEAQQQIAQPELSPEVIIVESQTPEVKELTEELEIPTKAVFVLVREKSGAKKRKKRRGNPDPEQTPEAASPEPANVKPPASDKRPECLICGKSFPTHQALGGHMAGHKYNKGDDPALVQAMQMQNILVHRRQRSNAIVGGMGAAEAAVAGAGQEDPATGTPREVAVPAASQNQECHDVQLAALPVARHACADCNMAFRSGQALGGHMRKHWFPGKQQARAALAAAPLNYDLNELPNDAEAEHQP